MTTPSGQLHALAEVDHCLEEGANLLSQAEERMRAISHAGAGEGFRLMGTQSLKAMRRTLLLMQEHRATLAQRIAVLPVAPSLPQASRWWRFASPRRAYQAKTL